MSLRERREVDAQLLAVVLDNAETGTQKDGLEEAVMHVR